MKELNGTFTQGIDEGFNTGGGVMNDVIQLKNGLVLVVFDQGICYYRDMEHYNSCEEPLTYKFYDEFLSGDELINAYEKQAG